MDKSDNAAFEVSVYFIEENSFFALIAYRLGGVLDAPMKHGSFSRPDRAGVLSIIADGYYDIEILVEKFV
jgi:hypothetical protein